ncbi:ATP-binding cassette domain-containing protein [Rathayibacter caricis]|nr:ATP-binding cassette domain-containing protein [Rathayibacter caricis]
MTIEIRDLEFRYSRRTSIFSNFSLAVDLFPAVLLGQNGAGKSTLLSLVAGTSRPQSGYISVGGRRSQGRGALRQLRRKTGWLPQDVEALLGFTTEEQVTYAGWLKGMSRGDAASSARRALEKVGLADMREKQSRSLSGGQRRRLGIAQAIVHDPKLVLLDEPYAGLDPEQRASVRGTLLELANTTDLMVSTHQTEDLEEVYKQVIVLREAKVLFSSSIATFYESAPKDSHAAVKAELAYTNVLKLAGMKD